MAFSGILGALELEVYKLNWQRLAKSVFILALLVVLVLSLAPVDHPDISPNDKINHLIAYTGLMILGFLAFRCMLIMAVVVFGWGLMIEFLQGLTAYRMMSGYDMLANSAGVALGCLILLVVNKYFKVVSQ